MKHSLQPHAAAAQEAARSLERALTSSRAQWDDATRQSFDRRHADVVVTSGRKVSDELASLAQELANAMVGSGITNLRAQYHACSNHLGHIVDGATQKNASLRWP